MRLVRTITSLTNRREHDWSRYSCQQNHASLDKAMSDRIVIEYRFASRAFGGGATG
jgi:hypothetical protein